jgi:hypothetical protein
MEAAGGDEKYSISIPPTSSSSQFKHIREK